MGREREKETSPPQQSPPCSTNHCLWIGWFFILNYPLLFYENEPPQAPSKSTKRRGKYTLINVNQNDQNAWIFFFFSRWAEPLLKHVVSTVPLPLFYFILFCVLISSPCVCVCVFAWCVELARALCLHSTRAPVVILVANTTAPCSRAYPGVGVGTTNEVASGYKPGSLDGATHRGM